MNARELSVAYTSGRQSSLGAQNENLAAKTRKGRVSVWHSANQPGLYVLAFSTKNGD